MPPKTSTKKSAKSEDDTKKKDTGKNSKKASEEASAADAASAFNDATSTKTAAINAQRGASQLGTPPEENAHKEHGLSTSELSHHTDGNRDSGEAGLNTTDSSSGAHPPEVDVKYEEPILPNLIVLE